MIAEILGIENQSILFDDWMPGDIKVFDVDNTKICNTLNMQFVTDFQIGLVKTIDWAKNYFKERSTLV